MEIEKTGDLVEYCKNRHPYVFDDLMDFLNKKDKYIKSQNGCDRVEMLVAYDKIYTTFKSLWVSNIISEKTWKAIVKVLKSEE